MRYLRMIANAVQTIVLLAGMAVMMYTGLYIFLRADAAIQRFFE